MGSEDMRRQAPNVERMHLMGATVVPVEFGTKTLKEATSEAIRDWITNVETTHYVIGSCVGPAPYPEIVRELQAVIGREAREQLLEAEGALPEAVVACVGGGSNAIGMFAGFIDDPDVRLIGVEAAGAASLGGGRTGRAPRLALVDPRRRATARSPTRTRSRPGSTTRASAPSTRSCATRAAPSTCPAPTRRRSTRSSGSRGPRGSSRRSSRRTRSRSSTGSTRSTSPSASRGAATRTWPRCWPRSGCAS